MMLVAHNLLAMNTQRQFGINTKNKAKSSEKLASGYKINRAADDAAGLSISEKMRRQIRGLTQGVANTEDGVSLCQVADGALAEVNDMLHRITELSVKAANGTNSEEERAMIQEEIHQILKEIDKIGNTTTFNERRLFTSENFDADINIEMNTVTDNGGESNTTSVMTREQAIRELTSGNFSVGTEDIEIDGKTITQDTIKRLAAAYSTEYLWYHYEEIKDDNTKRAEVDRVFSLMAKNIKSYMIGETYGTDGSQRYTQEQVDKMGDLFTNHLGNLIANTYVDSNDARDKFTIAVNNAGFGNPNPPLPSQINNLSQIASHYYFNNSASDSHSAITNQAGEAANTATKLLKNEFDTTFVDSKLWSLSFPYQDSVEDPIDRYIALAGLKEKTIVDAPLIPEDSEVYDEPTETLNIWIQSGCDSGVGMYITIDTMNTYELGIHKLNVSTIEGAENALKTIDKALQKVSANRSRIGAQQNRLEHTIANEENIIENTTAAESKIRDTDMAKEMVRFSNLNILDQVGQSMMAQANQMNQGVLSLLSQ